MRQEINDDFEKEVAEICSLKETIEYPEGVLKLYTSEWEGYYVPQIGEGPLRKLLVGYFVFSKEHSYKEDIEKSGVRTSIATDPMIYKDGPANEPQSYHMVKKAICNSIKKGLDRLNTTTESQDQ